MDTTKKMKIMVLAGGNDQAALIQELRRCFGENVEILLLDMNENVIARPFADRFLKISTMDKNTVLQAAKEEKIDYILTACGDQPLSTMAYVSAQMGLPCYLSEEDVRNLTNKIFMKSKMVNNGIPTAKFIVLESIDNVPDLSSFIWPLIVKPVDSNGSKGVKKVCRQEELNPFLKEAYDYSISKKVIIEEFKQGEELSVDVYVEGQKAKLLTISTSNKVGENKDAFTILQSEFPPKVDFSRSKVEQIAQQITDTFRLHDTPLLVQMIVDGDECNVVEFSARMGGGSKYHIVEVMTGVNIMQVYVDMIMGGKPTVEPENKWDYATMNYVYCRPGKFSSLENFDKLQSSGYIHSYFTYKMRGSIIEKSTTSSDRVAGFLIVGNSKQEIDEKLNYVNKSVRVLDSQGCDIMRHDFFEN